MSWKPQGASLPTRFKKAQPTTNYKQYPKDRLGVVDGYNLDSGVIFITEGDTGNKIEARIKSNKAPSARGSSNPQAAATNMSGNIIDQRMQEHIPVGSPVALESCETEKKISKPDGDVYIMQCGWVSSPPDPAPNKSFTSTLTINQHEGRVVSVQSWKHTVFDAVEGQKPWENQKGYWSIDPSSENGEKDIELLGKAMDQINAAYANSERVIGLGVQFSTLVQNGTDRDGKPSYEAVDLSPPFDWIRAERDGDGNIIKSGHPLTSEYLEQYLEGYLDYVYGSQDQSDENAEPGLVALGVIEENKEIKVEAVVYRALQGAPMSDRLELRNERTPLYRLSNVMTKFGQQDENSYVGKNWGFDGICFLTSDEAPKNRGDQWKARNLVTRLLTNGYNAHVRSMVPASDGGSVRVHPALDRVRENRADAAPAQTGGAPAQNRASAPAQDFTPSLEPAQVPFDDEDDGADPASYFLNAVLPQGQEETPAESDASTDTSTDNDAESAAPAEQKDSSGTEDKKSGSARFRRST